MTEFIITVNKTILMEFLLLGFSDIPDLKPFLFSMLLLVYMMTLAGNGAIIMVTSLEKSLQKPMYFFLCNLSILDICYTSTTMPKMLQTLLTENNSISFNGCVTQMYLFVTFVGTECVLLSVMSFDRFVAICRPLQYSGIMGPKFCINLASISWLCGFMNSLVHTVFTFRLNFCVSNRINDFYCDIPPLLSLACDDTTVNELLLLSIGVFIGWTPFLCIIVSYIYIIITIIKISSANGRKKSFSTCTSHLTVVILYYGSAIFNYVRPVSTYSLGKDRLISILFSIVTPTLNPLIYTLKNKDVIKAMKKYVL
ncbi:olfactory receptor 5V1-like [Bombina bombina]|uniref:olfactory receptor 5V1-like n=1 Tax=Bombina bombina TaxID=8345 RepID=UPI00235ACB99|nr:olfactory receptor 5V1-like [Bombina bombina]